jgi:hypothetical protein
VSDELLFSRRVVIASIRCLKKPFFPADIEIYCAASTACALDPKRS